MLNDSKLMGRLTRDPEIRYTQSNIPVATFCLAVERDFKGPDGNRQTDFIDIVAWRRTAEFVRDYLQKGRMVVVSGKLYTRMYEDKQGNKRKVTEINAENIYFADSKRSDSQDAFAPSAQQYTDAVLDGATPVSDDDLPF